jgi:hypothetical protein
MLIKARNIGLNNNRTICDSQRLGDSRFAECPPREAPIEQFFASVTLEPV